MKVQQMRELVQGLKNEGKLSNQMVEFVLDAKKYFASDIKAGTDTMAIQVTRDNYHPLTVSNFEESLNIASGELEISVYQGTNQKSVTESYLTDSSLELVLG